MKTRRVLWAVWVFAAALLYFFENNTGTRAVLIASVLVPVISAVCARCTADRVQITLAVPGSAAKGERIHCGVAVCGIPRFMPCRAVFCVNAHSVMSGGSVSASHCGDFEFVSDSCGAYEISIQNACAEDLFGLFTFRTQACAAARVIVRPDIYDVTVLTDNDEPAAIGENDTAYGIYNTPDEISGVREYIPGDPVRLIHWKLTAKLDSPVVRTAAPQSRNRVTLIPETRVPFGTTPEQISALAEAMLSVSEALLKHGIPHSVCVPMDSAAGMIDIENNEDYARLTGILTVTAFRTDSGSFCRTVAEQLADEIGSRTLIFAAGTEADTASLQAISDITLILPDFDRTVRL